MDIALGKTKAQIVFKHAKIINVFTKEIEINDIAVENGVIFGIGEYQGETEIDCSEYYVSPGFIDGHCHIESSMLTPAKYGEVVIPKGTTSVVADCHEIANVRGAKGIEFMLESAKKSPLDVFMMIPSCVPSTPYETSGAKLDASNIRQFIGRDNVMGLGEMMDYVGVMAGDEDVHEKIRVMSDKTVDGHAPGVKGQKLNAYILAGVQTDHECTTPEELIEKVRRGMYIHLREGSQTRNVIDLLPGVKESFINRLLFCTDDIHPRDITEIGHINNNINVAIQHGLDPLSAIQMATINIANCYDLRTVGAIAPGRQADLVLFKDINDIQPEKVFKKGKLLAERGKALFKTEDPDFSEVIDTVNVDLENIDLKFALKSDKVNVIQLIENNVTTKKLVKTIKLAGDEFLPKNNPDLLKLMVIERHHRTGNIGRGILTGYGLENGAIALTIAHDSHNLIVVGDNDDDMMTAIKRIKKIQGGIVLASGGKILEELPLKIGGLMSTDEPEFVIRKLINLENLMRKMGVKDNIDDPFLALAFLSLPVIPDLKCTDLGLFDVLKFKLISLEADDSR